MVSTHAHTIRRAMPQRTADRRLVAPTPTIAPVMVWVVLTGIPASEAENRVIAPAVSAQNPPTGLSLVIREPMVRTILQPPKYVPKAMEVCAARIIGQRNLPQFPASSAAVRNFAPYRAVATIPMVF